MKLKFKIQPFQTNAVEAVVECFSGQPMQSNSVYRIDSGYRTQGTQISVFEEGFKNTDLVLSGPQVLQNIQKVQRRQNLPISRSLTDFTDVNERGERTPASEKYQRNALAATNIHLDIEMETGTGKTYCYIKTIFEMNKRYGWSKFIIMVPSIAIREGVYKSLQITAEHLTENYGKKARFFIYNSKHLHELESFSSDGGINVMVINIQAFNASGTDNRRIYEELDDFQSRKPIDVIASNRPILILDEPQKMGTATIKTLPKFKPLMILRYSATHKKEHNQIHRLDALDAYNQKLVKRIAMRGIQTRGLSGANAYLYLEGIDISNKDPIARIELEVKLKSGEIKHQVKSLKCGDDLFKKSGGLDQYQYFTISQIDYNTDTIEFKNHVILKTGQLIRPLAANADDLNQDIPRIQIRETIKAHLNKEKQLFSKGIKVLSLFFIDEVVKYRDYDREDKKGEYALLFEREYEYLKNEYLKDLENNNEEYRKYLAAIDVTKTHNGYFSVDKKTKRLKDPTVAKRTGNSDDVDAYNLILKDKEQLLSLSPEKPTRFIFSHSALREGWDNPNVFVICMLKHSSSTISRRQEVGRGLRLSVDQLGNRIDHPNVVHDINVLTVVADESYEDFVSSLQKEISEELYSRPRQATVAYFTGKTVTIGTDSVTITEPMAKSIYRYLVKNDYTGCTDQVTEGYHRAKDTDTLAELPAELNTHAAHIFLLIDSVFSDAQLPKIDDDRKLTVNPLNANLEKKEFQELWSRINQKATYRVEFDSGELVQKCVSALNNQLQVTTLQYIVQEGIQRDVLTDDQLKTSSGFTTTKTSVEYGDPVYSHVKYDLIGKIAESAQLTRRSAAAILSSVSAGVFDQFIQNPEHFIAETSRIISEQKATMVIEGLTYGEAQDSYDVDIFTANQTGQDLSNVGDKLKKHVYDYVVTDSKVERDFVKELDVSSEVVVYAKLPRGFVIPTPVGGYNPDWAISFKKEDVKHVYFVAETKGSMSTMELRGIEKTKIECARKFFDEISSRISEDKVKYEIVTDYAKLMNIVGQPL